MLGIAARTGSRFCGAMGGNLRRVPPFSLFDTSGVEVPAKVVEVAKKSSSRRIMPLHGLGLFYKILFSPFLSKLFLA